MFKRKTLKKIVFLLIFCPMIVAGAAWVYNSFFIKIDTTEVDRYYDLLTKHAKSSKSFVLSLGVKEGEDLQIITDRLKKVMGLSEYEIWIGHHDDPKKPPAQIQNMGGYGIMGISMYSGITEKREEINLLVHELGHIYVWNLDKTILKGCDEEKVVDTSGIFLGLGILTLNGLTDDIFFVPGGGEYESKKRFFGYLHPSQFGYLFARYAREHKIAKDNIIPFLNSTGRKYFDMGYNYLERKERGGVKKIKPAGEVSGIYWCPDCGYNGSVSLTKNLNGLKCPKCSRPLH